MTKLTGKTISPCVVAVHRSILTALYGWADRKCKQRDIIEAAGMFEDNLDSDPDLINLARQCTGDEEIGPMQVFFTELAAADLLAHSHNRLTFWTLIKEACLHVRVETLPISSNYIHEASADFRNRWVGFLGLIRSEPRSVNETALLGAYGALLTRWSDGRATCVRHPLLADENPMPERDGRNEDWAAAGIPLCFPKEVASRPTVSSEGRRPAVEHASDMRTASRDLLEQLLRIARSQAAEEDCVKRRSVGFSPNHREMPLHTLASMIRGDTVLMDSEVLPMLFTDAAIKLIEKSALSKFWFWRLLAETAEHLLEQDKSLPVTSHGVNVGMRRISKSINAKIHYTTGRTDLIESLFSTSSWAPEFDLKRNNAAEIAYLTSSGALVVVFGASNRYSIRRNPVANPNIAPIESDTGRSLNTRARLPGSSSMPR